MKKRREISDEVFIRIGGKNVGRIPRIKIALKTPAIGVLRDGRTAKKKRGRWYYYPK